MSASVVDELSLEHAHARMRLAEINQMRQAVLAAQRGVTQREIARRLQVSQPTVHRLLGRAARLGIEPSIEEIVLRRFLGEISSTDMLRALSIDVKWVPRVVDPIDGVLPGGSAEDLEDLVDQGYLSEAEVDHVLQARGD